MNKKKMKKIYAFILYFFIVLLGIIMFTYETIAQHDSIQMIVKKWNGKEFIISDTIKVKIDNQLKDSSDLSKYVVISYIDSTTCTSCRIRAFEKTIENLKRETNKQIRSLLIIDSKTLSDVNFAVQYNGFKCPFVIDVEEKILKLNNIPKDDKIRTFLVDSQYHVILIGNPILNQNIFNLFVQKIKKG